ncbi:DUF1700 domain-containing protein [Oceanirhabdus sp. W0125-5]|uniref:DUF1700 domain-containing protein n=1 Tax=Oceanirhabdus sp. W0125-5 TaxID=2999116 RepID=UPI0022F2C4F5|nr:DUF1700 domain-containing protein [Oceanirhabdus sp. W0125-5]WBW98621.1 DUF1700 domain-containing protein [Oceanirhabdus sp. W0125-5]
MDRNTFIEKFDENLKRLPKNQREDIVMEIEHHISNAVSAGEKESVVLAKMGDPKVLAKTYIGDYYIQNNNTFKAIPFFIFTGFTSIFVVPVLGAISIGFGLASILTIIASILRTFGIGESMIHMSYWAGKQVPLSMSLLYGAPIAIILAIVAFYSWKGLRKYFRFIVASYHRNIKS